MKESPALLLHESTFNASIRYQRMLAQGAVNSSVLLSRALAGQSVDSLSAESGRLVAYR
ncbi:MAG: hypothetical protein R3F50_21645 [Gammaproteobacteria bacterium]|jgi:hypothetical protein